MLYLKRDFLNEKIQKFYNKESSLFKNVLEKVINKMMTQCMYTNNESLGRHNFGDVPLKLQNIPSNINSTTFEKDLLNSLDINKTENIDSSIIELLWGDIQLGKRIQACIIMWISVYILKRPVLYIFRNLKIDQKQLQDDITGTSESNFNIQYIKQFFDNMMKKEMDSSDWMRYKLPELKDITIDSILNKLSNKNSINPTDIFCCLMNHKQLEKINNKINEYICYNQELLNITLLVDESDLYAPTASNDGENKNDLADSTKCEQLLSKIYKKVRYVLHITGTAHSLLYNTTTKLTDLTTIQIPISKVHKMKRVNTYYGLFQSNDAQKIKFETATVKEWWNDIDNKTNKNKKYTIDEDYTVNIKNIITNILDKPQTTYHSFLISEEKIRVNHISLAHKIINDFPEIFVIIFHGNCLQLYLPKKYEQKIKLYSKQDYEKQTNKTSKRLWDIGGIHGSSINMHKSSYLPNNYCYFDIDTKKYNIKQVYKIIAMFFKLETTIKYRTAITITGKYGERGYSFTSDNYDKYLFHLTDQYFPCHVKNKNCTDISQRLRLQGKYNDNAKLTLWTSIELKNIITKFYIPFIKEIECDIMSCKNWYEIKDLIENIIDNGQMKFTKYMKYIDVSKKRKNIKIIKQFDSKYNGFRLIKTTNMNEQNIIDWCIKHNLPQYSDSDCVNSIKNDVLKDEFIKKYGEYDICKPIKYPINIEY